MAVKFVATGSAAELEDCITEAVLSKVFLHPSVVQTFACKIVAADDALQVSDVTPGPAWPASAVALGLNVPGCGPLAKLYPVVGLTGGVRSANVTATRYQHVSTP